MDLRYKNSLATDPDLRISVRLANILIFDVTKLHLIIFI